MKISIHHEILPAKNKKSYDDLMKGTINHKTYESNFLDQDMIDSPKGKRIERFIIDDMQITQKSDVDKVIEMLKNVRDNLER